MPLTFNPEAPAFMPGASLSWIPPASLLSAMPEPAQETLQRNPTADAPHLIIPTSTLLAPNLQTKGYTGPSSPEREKRPTLPRINSGLLLDTQEFDFDDAIVDFAVAHDSPRGIPCDITSPNGGSPSHVLWEPAGCNEEGKLVDQLLRKGEQCAERCTIKISCKDEGRGSPSKVDADSFEILHMIGQGGFGKVYQVRKKETGRIYAMKCMRKDCVIKDNLRGTKAERNILGNIRHAYIVNMHFAFQCRSRLYIVMDYFPGGQFLDMLHHHAPFDQRATEIYTAEIALALEELHRRGIVHRDLKPENLLVDSQGHISVTDFGCSKISEEEGQVRATSWAGTELYMAPEQLNKQQYGSEVDWWALGGLTWEMATGDHPFYANSRKTINYNILKKKLVVPKWLPANTHSLLKGLLTRDPTKRLGHEGGAEEVKAHPFFKTLDFEKLLNREIEAPLRSHAKTGDDLDVSGHSDRYTKASTTLSPIPSPHHLSSSNQAHFEGFSWQCENHHFPASFGSAPKNDAPTDATCEAESENVQFDEEEEEEEAEQEFTDKHVPSSAPMSIPIPRPKDRRTLAMPSAVSVSSPVMSCGSRPLFAAVF